MVRQGVVTDGLTLTTIVGKTAQVIQMRNVKMEERVFTAQDYRDKAEFLLKLGKMGLLDMLDLETQLAHAHIDWINARHDYLYSYYRVFHGQGELLNYLDISI